MISTVTTKGQVTIPKAIRERYAIHPHDKVDFVAAEDLIILRPVKTLRDFRGSVQGSGDFKSERQSAKESIGRRVSKELS